jgi:pilus assembly protein CpaB
MERRALTLSLGLSAIAMYLVYQYVSTETEKMEAEYTVFFPMVVASRDILQYETVRPTDVEIIQVPKAMFHSSSIIDSKDVIDAIAAVPIMKGEHFLDNKIISKNVYSGLDTQIANGRRAISISVDPQTSLHYMIRPGNRVDLAALFDYTSQTTSVKEVKVFLQDILVLAVGNTIQTAPPKGVDQSLLREILSKEEFKKTTQGEIREMLNHAKTETSYRTVTLEVTPIQAQVITYVLTVYASSISLLLRNTDDRQLERKQTTNIYDVMGPESYLVRGKKEPPQRAIPRPKYFDLVGDQPIPVMN